MNQSEKASNDAVPSSPWKRPKIVSLAKTNSLKRKSELFHSASSGSASSLGGVGGSSSGSALFNDETNLLGSPKSAKNRKTVLNRFSVNSFNGSSPSLSSSSNQFPTENNDLRSFFSGNSSVKFDLGPCEDDSGDALEKPASVAPASNAFKDVSSAVISNICFGLGNFPRTGSDDAKSAVEPVPEKKYAFQGELIPMDWSLKTKCRFISKTPFRFCTGLKSVHEYRAVKNFCKHDHFYENLSKHQFNSRPENEDLFKTLYCESICYWMAPFLPWMHLFPRSSMNGFSNLSNTSQPMSNEIQQCVFDSWNASFKSLYNGLRSGECPYFYFLTHSFMVLFRAENVGDIDEMHAILTPSTKGLRDSLKDVGFTMPLMPSNTDAHASFDDGNTNPPVELEPEDKSNLDGGASGGSGGGSAEESNQPAEAADAADNRADENQDENLEEEEDDTDEWLKEKGLDTVNLKPSVLQRNSKNAKKEAIQSLDSRPKSTLFFKGGDVHSLFNHLLNSKSCMVNSGPMAGIPPTLIAPIGFMGGVLQKFKVEQNIIKSLTPSGQSLTQYALDFIGPLMPYHVHRLCNLFSQTQAGEFEMTANTLYHSESFNCLKTERPVASLPVNENLGQSEASSLKKLYGFYGKVEGIKTLKLEDEIYSCNEQTQ